MNSVTDDNVTSTLSGTHIPSDKSGIADPAKCPDPVMPYGVFNAPNRFRSSTDGKIMVITGKPYSVYEMYFTREVCQNAGSLVVQFNFWIDAAAAKYAQVFESDAIWVIDGFKYNGSMQINNEEGGQVQIADSNGNWVDVAGAKCGILESYSEHRITVEYKFDTVAKTLQVVSIEIDGMTYIVLDSMQIKATPTDWTDKIVINQFQIARNALGDVETLVVEVDDLSNTWS